MLERSALSSVLGLPGYAAIAIALGFTALGVFIDFSRINGLGTVFKGCYFAGCVLAVCWVKRRAVFGPMVQPPLLLAVAVPSVVLISGEGAVGTGADHLLSIGAPLLNGFPTMAVTTAFAVGIGAVRYVVQRPLAPEERPRPTGRPSAQGRPGRAGSDRGGGRAGERAGGGRAGERAGGGRAGGERRGAHAGGDRAGGDRIGDVGRPGDERGGVPAGGNRADRIGDLGRPSGDRRSSGAGKQDGPRKEERRDPHRPADERSAAGTRPLRGGSGPARTAGRRDSGESSTARRASPPSMPPDPPWRRVGDQG
jgi:hypothetical protein